MSDPHPLYLKPGLSNGDIRVKPRIESDADWNRQFGGKTIPELFAEQVDKVPDAPALRDHRGILTYRELAVESDFLASRLRSCGVLRGQLVVIDTAQTRETIIALLAVLQVGAAYTAPQSGAEVSTQELREFMQARLPNYMIPRSIAFLAALPLNANGKVDRSALRALHRDSGEIRQPPDGAGTEAALFKIWREVLRCDDPANDQDFFEVGGTSLSATHLLARIQRDFGKSIPMSVFLKGATIAELARFLDQCPRTSAASTCVLRNGGNRPALFCLPAQGGNLLCYANMGRHFSSERPVYGVQSRRFLSGSEGQSMVEMATHCRQTILQQQPDGPYHLFGFCFGGLLAYEVACQLSAQGAEVGLVGVLDYAFPDPVSRRPPVLHLAKPLDFLKTFSRGVAALARIRGSERKGVIRRLRLRMGGLLRGRNWNEAYLDGLKGPSATKAEREELFYELASRNYVTGAFPNEVTLFRQERLPVFQTQNPTMGWSEATGGRVRLQVIKGALSHGAALEKPHAMTLAHAVESCIA